MIRFSYDCPVGAELPFKHFSIEGDNKRGYLLLGWDNPPGKRTPDEVMLQQWFDTLGEALDFCAAEFGIVRNDWAAPTVQPPSATFKGRERRRQGADPDRDHQGEPS